LKIKIFGQKSKFLAHSKGCNRLKIIVYSVFATLGQNSAEYMTKSTKNSQIIVKIIKKYHYGGRFLKKCHTEYFLIYLFGNPLRCPTTSHQWFAKTPNFGKLALKNRCGQAKPIHAKMAKI
jgi:hypothetical protein